jgi:molybdate transport system substrate-binding protein
MTPISRVTAVVTVVLAAVVTAAACSPSGSVTDPPSGTGASLEGRELVVFAASSLAGAFTEIGAAFEQTHPGVIVTFNFGASDGLARQIQSEATADVFASASPSLMDAVQQDPGVARRVDFARNRLVLVTPSDNPGDIASLRDLTRGGVQLILASDGVPIGAYARQVLDNAGILDAAVLNVVSNEDDSASLVQKIAAGEADAALVYASDVSGTAGNDVAAIEIPKDVNVEALYPIAVVEGSDDDALAAAFIDDVSGPLGQATLERFGFEPAVDAE